MFEITGDHIAELNEEDLRSLIGLLCEDELRRRGLPVSAVSYSGDQNAKDGGLDVRVALPAGTVIDGFIPKAATGFQVKLPDMPRQAIIEEMKPSGVVRPSIVGLAKEDGAYIIVSANGSTADTALSNRRKAMAKAMQGEADAGKLALDFYDRGRIATWVRDHPGRIPWVREKIGKSIPGWRSYGAWSHNPDVTDDDYLVDDAARIKAGTQDEGDGYSAVEGINRIRDVLRQPGQVVRLVGLSGVGKTRLLEALFDGRIGTNSLDPSLAVYTNVAEGPDPQPPGLASDFLAAKTRAIFVVDNCPPELHSQLSQLVRVTGSTLSVITVEYDIREDQPEGTDVFALEPSSVALIEKLLDKRFAALSQVDCHLIAEFSGGNARVAIALASTVEKNETIAGLSDADLFRRLFHQRHAPDDSLLLIAQACSIVYSFQGHDLTGDNAELPILGSLIGKTADEMFRGIVELRRRDLLQERGVWRAVLPHAIANRLATMALENIPAQTLEAGIIKGFSERLLKSFSRRLGFLDTSKDARKIVAAWLASGGLLGDTVNLDDLGKEILNNVAPVMPEETLSALERGFVDADADTLSKCTHFVRLLRSLAYDSTLFERAAALLLKLISFEGQKDVDAAKVLESFGYIYLSGTHATIEQRLSLTDRLMRSPTPALQQLGADLLTATLETDNFTSGYLFEFGARSRDHGYHPKTSADVAHWFTSAIKLAETVATSNLASALLAQKAIATSFRGLWSHVERFDDLERISRALAGNGFWRDGWIAARQTRLYGAKELSPDSVKRLSALEEFLRPKDLVSRVRGIVLEAKGGGLDFDDLEDEDADAGDYEAAAKRAAAAIENLGKDVAVDSETFKTVLPELMAGGGRLGPFGHALALGADKPRELWDALVHQLGKTTNGNSHVLSGFLAGLQKRDAAEADILLDEALEHPTLAAWFPYLQANVAIDDKGVARLYRALELDKASIDRFSHLAWGRACEPISGPAFRDLALAIAKKAGGSSVALHMLSMRLHSDRSEKRPPLPETIETGRTLLSTYEFSKKENRAERDDHELASIIKASLAGSQGQAAARRLIGQLKEKTSKYDIRAWGYGDATRALFQVQPEAMLEEFFSGDEKAKQVSVRMIEQLSRLRQNPLGAVPDAVLLAWCAKEPAVRFPIAAAVGVIFKPDADNMNNNKSPLEWTPLTASLLGQSSDPKATLSQIIQRLYPNGWGGSWATTMESRAKLLDTLNVGESAELKKALDDARATLRKQIESSRIKEAAEDKERSSRFE